MTKPLLMTVPNYSEGRDQSVIAALVAAHEGAGAHVVDIHTDADHNRTVLTVLAAADAIVSGLIGAATVAIERIDLNTHSGVHPRIGSCDVQPLVALDAFGVEESTRVIALACAEELGAAMGALGIPVYMYAQSARTASTFAGALRGSNVEVDPDYGPASPHPRAGASIVGVRAPLIAFNVILESDNLGIAQRIARTVRQSSGGFDTVRALGVLLESQGKAQVSMNIEAWRLVSPAIVYDAIEREIASSGIGISHCEIVGLIPHEALHELRTREVRIVCSDEPEVEYWIERYSTVETIS